MKSFLRVAIGASLVAAPLAAQQPEPHLASAFRSGPVALTRQANGNSRSSSEKFFASLSLNGSAFTADDLSDETDSGGGVTLELGYGFTPRWSLFVEGAAATMSDRSGGDYILSHFDIGARYTFANRASAWSPFIDAAFTGRAAGQENITIIDNDGRTFSGDLEVSGVGFSVGGGLNYFFNPRWAVTTALKWTTGEFTTIKFGSVTLDALEI